MAMLAVSVSLIDELVTHFRRSGSQAVVVSGISLGGWVTNLHRTYRGAADLYAPLLAGAALGDLFLTSIYRRMAGRLALDNPDTIRRALNFEVDFMRKAEDDVRPLLGRFDQFIRYERQKRCYGDRPITVLDKGHITGVLSAGDLRRHILSCIDGHR